MFNIKLFKTNSAQQSAEKTRRAITRMIRDRNWWIPINVAINQGNFSAEIYTYSQDEEALIMKFEKLGYNISHQGIGNTKTATYTSQKYLISWDVPDIGRVIESAVQSASDKIALQQYIESSIGS